MAIPIADDADVTVANFRRVGEANTGSGTGSDDSYWNENTSVTVINPPGTAAGENTPWRNGASPTSAASTMSAAPSWRTAAPQTVVVRGQAHRVLGRYAMYEEIARGGMASVHLGQSLAPGDGRPVAIKRLFPQLAANPNFVAMFLDEARLAARVRHPNVVAPLDVVVRTNEGELYLILEYVHGEALAHLLTRSVRQGRALPTDVAIGIMVDVLSGLHAAHEATSEEGASLGMVHRDISPQNIIVGADGVARVADFGVAKATAQHYPLYEDERPGKPSYLAPEEIRIGNIDRRADLFSAGVVLWELLARRRLFRHGNPNVVAMKILSGDIPPPSHFNPEVSTALDAVVLRAMERNRDHRYVSARAFKEAILAVLRPATPATTAAWVQQVSGDRLTLRSERLAEITSFPRRAAPGWRSLFGEPTTWGRPTFSRPREERPSRRRWVTWGGGGTVALGLLAMAMWSSPGRAVAPQNRSAIATSQSPLSQRASATIAAPTVPAPPLAPALTPAIDDAAAAESPDAAREATSVVVFERPSVRRASGKATTATTRIASLNQRALAAYQRRQYDAAHRLLRTALTAAQAAKLSNHPVAATTRTRLGLVLLRGFRQHDLAVEQFRKALQIDPTLSLPRRATNRQLHAAFVQAKAGD